mmetsp:Transcript_30161/g.69150  ORF Transcript_30161/g.69150 Transcript_30161/m.69150 type:complete len:334 (-) Transcript_30161:147-1148(-)
MSPQMLVHDGKSAKVAHRQPRLLHKILPHDGSPGQPLREPRRQQDLFHLQGLPRGQRQSRAPSVVRPLHLRDLRLVPRHLSPFDGVPEPVAAPVHLGGHRARQALSVDDPAAFLPTRNLGKLALALGKSVAASLLAAAGGGPVHHPVLVRVELSFSDGVARYQMDGGDAPRRSLPSSDQLQRLVRRGDATPDDGHGVRVARIRGLRRVVQEVPHQARLDVFLIRPGAAGGAVVAHRQHDAVRRVDGVPLAGGPPHLHPHPVVRELDLHHRPPPVRLVQAVGGDHRVAVRVEHVQTGPLVIPRKFPLHRRRASALPAPLSLLSLLTLVGPAAAA